MVLSIKIPKLINYRRHNKLIKKRKITQFNLNFHRVLNDCLEMHRRSFFYYSTRRGVKFKARCVHSSHSNLFTPYRLNNFLPCFFDVKCDVGKLIPLHQPSVTLFFFIYYFLSSIPPFFLIINLL